MLIASNALPMPLLTNTVNIPYALRTYHVPIDETHAFGHSELFNESLCQVRATAIQWRLIKNDTFYYFNGPFTCFL